MNAAALLVGNLNTGFSHVGKTVHEVLFLIAELMTIKHTPPFSFSSPKQHLRVYDLGAMVPSLDQHKLVLWYVTTFLQNLSLISLHSSS